MYFRPSQWVAFLLANAVSRLRAILPAFRQWAWYGFRRVFLICSAKYAIDTFWLCCKKRKLGVTYMRELSLMSWVAPNFHYKMDAEMRILIRKCGYHYTSAGIAVGKRIEPWFYGDIKDDTKQILERMEAKASKNIQLDKKAQAEEMQSVLRVLKNFKDFTMAEIMTFFQVSKLTKMEEGEVIFGPDDMIEYYYGVVSGQIFLYGEGISDKDELLKVADSDDCIVSLIGFLRYFIYGPEKYSTLKIHAKCGKAGKYYRIPISEIVKYTRSDKEKTYEILSSVLVRTNKFKVGVNDLTGIIPRLHDEPFLNATYDQINFEPGILTGTKVAEDVFVALDKIFPIKKEDKKMCWVGVLDSRTILLRRFKETKYAFYIHKGLLACTVSKLRRSYNAVQFYLSSGQIVGWREAAVGIEMAVQYQVADGSKAIIVAIPAFLLREYLKTNPEMVVGLVKKVLERHSLLNSQLSYTLRFTYKRANEAIYRKTDLSKDGETYAYLCLSGRLRFIFDKSTHVKKSSGYGIIESGEWFGLVACYTDDPLVHRTVICDRYSEYVCMPRQMLSLITRNFREAAGYQCDYLARNLHRDHEHTFLDTDKMLETRCQVNSYGTHSWRTFKMICIYPASSDIPAKIYCDELARHHICAASVITREEALTDMNVKAFTRDNEYALAKWLIMQEERTTLLFLVATNDFNDFWNETIAKLCDMLQVLVTYNISHKPSENETHILQMATKARKELVFIHPVIRVTKPQVGPGKFPYLPKGSILWLKPRSWIQRHHHVRMLDSALRYAKLKDPVDLEKYMNESKDPDKHSDYARVVRWISGQSIGIVLGGGGAKGAAHLGVLRYLHELDVPVDYIAGVSIGSFLGALYAMFENIHVVETKARELWEEFKNPFRYARDLPFHPFSAGTRGHAFNWMINYFFESVQIEDLYIPYFCVTSDLHDKCSRTHMSGDLWFYVRASMTLTLIFPPQINQYDYHLLMDGGYSDLVPAMTMRKMGIKYLVAINIGDERMMKTFNIGYHVSGLKCLLQSCMPFSIDTIPNHFDIWDALLYCSARNFLQILKAMDEYCVYIRPNINAYSALDFQNFEEIKTLGYLSTKFKFGGLKLKNLPVHVIWYLLRFYTYPNVPQSQAQILQGFTDDDWEFAVNLMSKTQMFQRAKTTFLKMNLTPYLADLMEARSYLENIMKQDELQNINLHVPVLENFSRDDERLDLVHAIARYKEWAYMEDIESILEGGRATNADLKIRTKVNAAPSQTHDLLNAKLNINETYTGSDIDLPEDAAKQIGTNAKTAYSLKDLFEADPALYTASLSYHNRNSSFGMTRKQPHKLLAPNEDDYGGLERSQVDIRNSEFAFHMPQDQDYAAAERRQKTRTNSVRSLHNLLSGFFNSKKGLPMDVRPHEKGQRFDDFRKCYTLADRNIFHRQKLAPIMTLKQLRKSFRQNVYSELE